MYLECFEYRKYGWLHVGIDVGVGAGLEQVLERVAEPGGGQVEAVDDSEGLQQEQRITAFPVALQYDDRHGVCDHSEHDENANHVQLNRRLEATSAGVPGQQKRRVGLRGVGTVVDW